MDDRDKLIERTCDAFGHLFDALDVGAGDPPGTTWEDRSHITPHVALAKSLWPILSWWASGGVTVDEAAARLAAELAKDGWRVTREGGNG